jgi:23S rRNA pseudouridine1911/1915/1917 synthase
MAEIINREILTHIVTPGDTGRRIRQILLTRLGMSRALIQRLRENDRVRLNGHPVFLTQFVQAGDILNIDLQFDEDSSIIPEQMELDIVYEDEDFLALNKPPGIIVHPVGQEISGTLANGVIHHWLEQGIRSKFRPIHRLDRNTSGLVLVGKNQFAHQSLFRQFLEHRVRRWYLALVEGYLSEPTGTIAAPIGRKPGSIVERWVTPDGQEAITHFEVLATLENASLLRLNLETGRTHQIRVHLQHLGHSLLGDTLYGGTNSLISRQALHSFRFEFSHPRTFKTVTLEAPLAPDIEKLLTKLKKELK